MPLNSTLKTFQISNTNFSCHIHFKFTLTDFKINISSKFAGFSSKNETFTPISRKNAQVSPFTVST